MAGQVVRARGRGQQRHKGAPWGRRPRPCWPRFHWPVLQVCVVHLLVLQAVHWSCLVLKAVNRDCLVLQVCEWNLPYLFRLSTSGATLCWCPLAGDGGSAWTQILACTWLYICRPSLGMRSSLIRGFTLTEQQVVVCSAVGISAIPCFPQPIIMLCLCTLMLACTIFVCVCVCVCMCLG